MDNNQITALGKLQAEDRQVNNAKISQNLANCDNRFDNILKDSSNKPTAWCPDLPLKGAGYSTPYYLKD